MELIANILLISASFGAAAYCYALHRKLNRLNQLDGGIGGAIAVLSLQVDEMTRMLEQAKGAASLSTTTLSEMTQKAETSAARLELLLSALHDLDTRVEPERMQLLARRQRQPRTRRSEPEVAA